MNYRDMMNTRVKMIDERESVASASAMMARDGVQYLVVSRYNRYIVGMLSRTDTLGLAEDERKSRRVQELMMTDLVLVDLSVLERNVEELGEGFFNASLPMVILDEDELVGIITPEAAETVLAGTAKGPLLSRLL